ncbi:MAG: hypothetical protein PUD85_04550 [Bacteroidales bacterium]|nr:hypothetical protein [Bacteroidales bacterium]
MKKILLSITFFLIALFVANAQGKIYCELVGTQRLLSTKVTVEVDFGQQSKFFADNRLVDEKGQVVVFNSMVDAMNYMGELGWEFEQAYVVTFGSGSSSSSVYHWLLSKYVGEEGDNTELKTKDIVRQEMKAVKEADKETESKEE